MTEVFCGTAHLYGVLDPVASLALLRAAHGLGVRRFDTAPSYGRGRSEAELGALVGSWGRDGFTLTTKLGIAPAAGPAGLRRVAGRLVRMLPATVSRRVRGAALATTHGRFEPAAVRASVEVSLERLGGRIERLMLHEVAPGDITPELLEVLRPLLAGGEVAELGVATANDRTAACVARAPELLTAVHVDGGLLAAPVALPASVTTRVAHGALGPAGTDLAVLVTALRDDAELAAGWRAATAGTPYAGPGGVADALLTAVLTGSGPHVPAGGYTDVIVATSRPANLARALDIAGTAEPLPAPVASVLASAATRLHRPAGP